MAEQRLSDFLRDVRAGKVEPMKDPPPLPPWMEHLRDVDGKPVYPKGAPIRVFHDGKELALKSGEAWPWETIRLDIMTCYVDEPFNREGWFEPTGPRPFAGSSVLVIVPAEGQVFAALVIESHQDGACFFKSNGGPKPWGRALSEDVTGGEMLPPVPPKEETWRDRPPLL